MADTTNMADTTASEIIEEWQREDSEAGNMMNLYQSTANHFYPNANSITTTRSDGEDKSLPVLDPTGELDMQDMAAGMSAVLIPEGQFFFRLLAEDDRLNDLEHVRSYLNRITQMTHSYMSQSNFGTEFNTFIPYLICFGTGNISVMWDQDTLELMYKNWHVSCYRFRTDKKGQPNYCLIRWQYTACEAYEMWGEAAGPKVVEAYNDPKTKHNKFWFIYRVQQNLKRDPTRQDNANYKFSETVVNEAEKLVVKTNGHKEFPYMITRWLMASNERWGRGQGTIALSADKELQSQHKALLLCADLANNPPRQTLASFEGTPKVYPGANNVVMEADSIRALDRNLQGNFPITKDTVEMTRETLHRCFYVKVFAPLDNLPGDRRTTVEIIERVKAGYQRLIQPTKRLYQECLTPLIRRSVLLLMRNFMLPAPPPELKSLKIKYLGRLALALEEQQADALQRFSQFAINMEAVLPHFLTDNINVDRAGRRMATTFGVNEGDFNTDEERAAIRQERKQMEMAQMAMAAAESGSKVLKNVSNKPEAGSPAEAMMSGMN